MRSLWNELSGAHVVMLITLSDEGRKIIFNTPTSVAISSAQRHRGEAGKTGKDSVKRALSDGNLFLISIK